MMNKQAVDACVGEKGRFKWFVSDDYNYVYDRSNGNFCRWGKTKEDDPMWSPAPELLDLEISTGGCPGVGGSVCRFCYKSNGPDNPQNMTLEQFKNILNKFPKSLTQIAFGITGVQTNPDFIPMMRYAKENGITPNFTLTGSDLTDDLADEIASLVGGLAVSVYDSNPDVCYDTVKKFSDRGIRQTNIHLMVAQETIDFAKQVVRDSSKDKRLAGLNAIVLLGVKPKGRAKGHFNPLTQKQFNNLCEGFFSKGVRLGFDSCSAPKFDAFVKQSGFSENAKQTMSMFSESCESTLFSSYINSEGLFFPCSFCECENGWEEGLNVLEANDFVKDIWLNEKTVKWRTKLIDSAVDGVRTCPVFKEINP